MVHGLTVRSLKQIRYLKNRPTQFGHLLYHKGCTVEPWAKTFFSIHAAGTIRCHTERKMKDNTLKINKTNTQKSVIFASISVYKK